ncbi:MAG: 5-methyltetrahydropteroyltriglutamate--homocysteine S-methyltransferase [Spirochaetota bacterium]
MTHNLGYPRIGRNRETKFALERYWNGAMSRDELDGRLHAIREERWRTQQAAGIDLIPVGEFPPYDHVLATTIMLDLVPERFRELRGRRDQTELAFAVGRGVERQGSDLEPSPMTKWFNTNYHYIRPELSASDRASADPSALLEEIEAAQAAQIDAKPVLLGPLSYLYLAGLTPQAAPALFDSIVEASCEIVHAAGQRVSWIEFDEPALALDLDDSWAEVYCSTYERLSRAGEAVSARTFVASYFGLAEQHESLLASLSVDGIHLDDMNAFARVVPQLRDNLVVSAGIVNGRSVFRSDLEALLDVLEPWAEQLGDRLWIAPSCSLLHVPIDVTREQKLDPVVRNALAFADQKLAEVVALGRGLASGRDAIASILEEARAARAALAADPRTYVRDVRERSSSAAEDRSRRLPYAERRRLQAARLDLPPLPTTTIGSFPQTAEIRRARREWRRGKQSTGAYERAIEIEIKRTIEEQEALGLDVLVHGEAERTDMVEYFAEQLEGFVITEHGWVQSYGSRCVRPPVIYGDISRPRPMTVRWLAYAKSLTWKPLKGMLTGPITILKWSFPREDLSEREIATQIALALREEVADLDKAGLPIIQVDEPALREGVPLRKREREAYLEWAPAVFRLAVGGATNQTQIHTHMCYSDFNEILDSIVAMDADVITIEAARSRMRLLEGFERVAYPNDVGPGIYDIHAPLVPSVEQIERLLSAALKRIPADRLWVNPDCGLKTRGWRETIASLRNMVEAARRIRAGVV